MKTAQYIAICDHRATPDKKSNCVFANQGSEPFNNLAKGATITMGRATCNLNCIKQWWTGNAQRLGWMTWTCNNGVTDYSKGLIYHACGNGNGLHMQSNSGACGWNNNYNKLPSVWIQTPPPSKDPSRWQEIFDCYHGGTRTKFSQKVSRGGVIVAMKTAKYIAICDHGATPGKTDTCVYSKRGSEPFN